MSAIAPVSCTVLLHRKNKLNPKHSMYAIYAYIGVVLGVNVGKYAIHGVFGN